MPDRVRIGVIGAGFGEQVHIPAFQLEGLEVVAVCACRAARARDWRDGAAGRVVHIQPEE